jgi:hypothetical protein
MRKENLWMRRCWIGYVVGCSLGDIEDSERIFMKDCVAGLSRLGVGLGNVINEELAGSAVEDGDSDEEKVDGVTLAAEDFTDIAEVSSQLGLIRGCWQLCGGPSYIVRALFCRWQRMKIVSHLSFNSLAMYNMDNHPLPH